jgi:3,4-dihydroxy 2-butanone 4-phosphate synthase / GTP cyclohydrolase II
MSIAAIEEAIEDIRNGKMVIVADEEDRENEGDLTMAAEKVTPEAINFMATWGRGLICLAMTPERLEHLRIPEMVSKNESILGTAFCVSIEGRKNVSTGISASDRAQTILTAVHPEAVSGDLIRPGHIFPLKGAEGGVLSRSGQTEASIDLARLAGLSPTGVICEIMNPDGTMARMPELKVFAAEHGLKVITVVDLIKYRMKNEKFVRRIKTLPYETELGSFDLHVYENLLTRRLHLAFTKGKLDSGEPVILRVQVSDTMGDVFSFSSESNRRSLRQSLEIIGKEGRGALVYLRLKKTEEALLDEIEQLTGFEKAETYENAGIKDFGLGAQIVADLGISEVRLLTNHPKVFVGLSGYGIKIREYVSIGK